MIFPSDMKYEVPELYPIGDWLALLRSEVYDRQPHGILKQDDRFSAFGLFLEKCGVTWIEHPHSPGTYYPYGATYFTHALPKEFCRLYGEVGRLYWFRYRDFNRIARASFANQETQIRLWLELDARRKVRQHERKLRLLSSRD